MEPVSEEDQEKYKKLVEDLNLEEGEPGFIERLARGEELLKEYPEPYGPQIITPTAKISASSLIDSDNK